MAKNSSDAKGNKYSSHFVGKAENKLCRRDSDDDVTGKELQGEERNEETRNEEVKDDKENEEKQHQQQQMQQYHRQQKRTNLCEKVKASELFEKRVPEINSRDRRITETGKRITMKMLVGKVDLLLF